MFDIKGNIVNIGDKVLVSEKKELRLGTFEKVTKISFIIRVGKGGYAYSIKRKKELHNPLWVWKDYIKDTANYPIKSYIEYVDDAWNKEILKVDDDFSL